MVDSSFPYDEIIRLIFTCFRATFDHKVDSLFVDRINNIQNQSQTFDINNLNSSDTLNKTESMLWMYKEMLGKLDVKSLDNSEKIIQSIKLIQKTQSAIEESLESRASQKFRRKKAFREKFVQTSTRQETKEITKIFNKLIGLINQEKKSDQILEKTIEKLKLLQQDSSYKLDINQLICLSIFEDLLGAISEREVYNLSVEQLKKVNIEEIKELRQHNYDLSQKIAQLLDIKRKDNNILMELVEENDALREEEKCLTNKFKYLEEKNIAIKDSYQKQNKYIHRLEANVDNIEKQLKALKNLTENQSQKIRDLTKTIQTKETDLQKFSKYKPFNGMFIGNLSNKGSKFHFDRACRDWKMLIGDYILNLSGNRDIRNDNSPDIFLKYGLSECENCAAKKKSNYYK